MQNDTPYSLMVWENVTNLPFPEYIKPIVQKIKWDQFEWHVLGLPISFAKYTISGGKELYLSELPDETIKVEKMSEFTGNILMGGYFVNEEDPDGFNYFVNFLSTIVKGEVLEVKLQEVHKQPVREYQEAMNNFQVHIKKVMRTSGSWWFKWLYRPWFLCIRGAGWVSLMILKFFRLVVVKTVHFLTPI